MLTGQITRLLAEAGQTFFSFFFLSTTSKHTRLCLKHSNSQVYSQYNCKDPNVLLMPCGSGVSSTQMCPWSLGVGVWDGGVGAWVGGIEDPGGRDSGHCGCAGFSSLGNMGRTKGKYLPKNNIRLNYYVCILHLTNICESDWWSSLTRCLDRSYWFDSFLTVWMVSQWCTWRHSQHDLSKESYIFYRQLDLLTCFCKCLTAQPDVV